MKTPLQTYPLPKVTIPAKQSANVFTSFPSANGPFKPTWFNFPKEISEHILITDIKVGKNSQLLSGDCIPASLFSDRREESLRTDMTPTSMALTLSIFNTSDKPIDFSGDVMGFMVPRVTEKGIEEVTREGIYILGLGWSLIDNNSIVTVRPQVPMTPSRLYVPGSLLENLEIKSIISRPYTHGYQLKSEPIETVDDTIVSKVPSEMLTLNNLRENGTIHLSPLGSLNAGDFFLLQIQNKTQIPQYFTGAIIGIPEKFGEQTN